MRVFYVAITVIAAIAGAGGIRAAVVGTGPAGINPLAADRTIAGGLALAPNGIRPQPGLGRVSARMCKQVSVSLPYRGDSHDDQ